MSASEEITKELVEDYEDIRSVGHYNMITDAETVIDMLECSKEAYFELQAHYRDYCKKFDVKIS